MISDAIISIMEWIGTISFAVSGALVAIGCSLDVLGVVTVGCVTAVGGGIIRDTIIGNIPPKVFSHPGTLLLAVATSIVVFLISYIYRKKFKQFRETIETFNVLFDALGLAAFSIAGVEVVCLSINKNNVLLVILLGVITGVGGGVLRDVLVNEKPYVLTKHVYAVVSILGCCFYYLFSVYLNYKVFATIFVLIFTVTIRMLAAKYRWKLPKINISDNENE